MKILNRFLFCTIALLLISCQPKQFSCEKTTNPFPTPSGLADEYQYNPNIEIRKVCSFTGEVTRGQVYSQKITEDLVFCLIPNSFWGENGGWTINISDDSGNECDDNFAGIVTPPFHGDNDIFIQGWQYRDIYDIQENGRIIRYFNFIFTQEDFETIFNASFDVNNDETIDLTKIPRSRGVFTISELELGDFGPDEQAWIESMKFEVKIYLPEER